MKRKRRSYKEELTKFNRVMNISIESLKKYPPKGWTIDDVNSYNNNMETYRRIDCEPRFRNLTSLQYDINAVLTYFQEATGDAVEYFWKTIKEENLGYQRKNKLDTILKRGKIRGRIEYEYSKDIIVVAQQIGMITKKEAEKLGNMIHQFEFR